MPIYEYRCERCGHELEKIQKISDPALTDCPACGQPTLKKQISAAGFRLKGSGWYETDFKKGNQKNLHDSGEKSEQKDLGEKKETKSVDTGGSNSTGSSEKAATPAAKPAENKSAD